MNATLETPGTSEPRLVVFPHEAMKPKMIHRQVTDEHICILYFDRPESSANIFDRAALWELREQLEWIAGNPELKGVVLASAKKSIFIAGADLHTLSTGTP